MSNPASILMIDGDALLDLWESAMQQPETKRADGLLHAMYGGSGISRTLGERNALLAKLHSELFGRNLELRSQCPGCGTIMEFTGDCDMLAVTDGADDTRVHQLQVDGHCIEFRLPSADDLSIAEQHQQEDDFAAELLRRCVITCKLAEEPLSPQNLPVSVLDVLSRHIETLDPLASLSFRLSCHQCAAQWDSALDLADLVWNKLHVAAEMLLLDVDALARVYGWTERDVIGLSPTRRAAYVQMAAS